MTSDLKITTAREEHDSVVRVTDHWDTKLVFGGCAGFVVDECSVVCHECLDEDRHENPSMINGCEEWDYPGYACEECRRYLDVLLLVYPDGPGDHLYEELEE
jgi:hypothetical protein